MKTIYVLKNVQVVSNSYYKRIVYLDAYDFEKLDRLKPEQEEAFISSLPRTQVWTINDL